MGDFFGWRFARAGLGTASLVLGGGVEEGPSVLLAAAGAVVGAFVGVYDLGQVGESLVVGGLGTLEF